MMVLCLLFWLVIVAAVAGSIKARSSGDRTTLWIGCWLLFAGVMIGLHSLWLVVLQGADSDVEVMISWMIVGVLILAGAIMVPMGACKILAQTKQELSELRNALAAMKEPPKDVYREDKVPAWKRVQQGG